MSACYSFDRQLQPGWTPLHVAACNGHLVVVRCLIQRRHANMKARTFVEGETPLHVAAQNGHASVVQCLLTHGADVNARNKKGCTPLDLAVSRGHVDVVQLIMELRASNANKEQTALQLLRQEGDFFVESLHWWWGHHVGEILGNGGSIGTGLNRIKAEKQPLISSTGTFEKNYVTM